MSLIEKDIKLVQEISLKSGGANIHAVNQSICNYEAFVKMANGKAWWIKEEDSTIDNREHWKVHAQLWEDYMRKFVATGKWDKYKPKVIF